MVEPTPPHLTSPPEGGEEFGAVGQPPTPLWQRGTPQKIMFGGYSASPPFLAGFTLCLEGPVLERNVLGARHSQYVEEFGQLEADGKCSYARLPKPGTRPKGGESSEARTNPEE